MVSLEITSKSGGLTSSACPFTNVFTKVNLWFSLLSIIFCRFLSAPPPLFELRPVPSHKIGRSRWSCEGPLWQSLFWSPFSWMCARKRDRSFRGFSDRFCESCGGRGLSQLHQSGRENKWGYRHRYCGFWYLLCGPVSVSAFLFVMTWPGEALRCYIKWFLITIEGEKPWKWSENYPGYGSLT